MNTVIQWIKTFPLPFLEGGVIFTYIIAIALAIAAFGGFTFRPGDYLRKSTLKTPQQGSRC